MSKRQTQEEKLGEEERVVAKSKPKMSLVLKTATQSPTALGSSAFDSPVTLKAHSSSSDCGETHCERFERKHIIELSSVAFRCKYEHCTGSNVGHLEKPYSNRRQKLGCQPGDDMLESDVNAMIWESSVEDSQIGLQQC